MQMRKFKCISMLVILFLLLGCVQYPACSSVMLQADAAMKIDSNQYISTSLTGTVTNNRSNNVYWTYGRIINSYLSENQDGTWERVEYIEGGNIIVEKYSGDYTLLDSKEITCEAPYFGGFYSGKDYNFLVYGRSNPNESYNQEVVRVIKYSKDWERLGKCALNGMNTTVPFDAGSLRMTEADGQLYIYTCHQMYQSADGFYHQANMTFRIDEETMTLAESQCQVANIALNGYVSHSFNQFIKADGNVIYRVDHGDAYPRGISITKSNEEGSFMYPQYTVALPVQGNIGDNNTGVSVGGFELSDTNCLIAGNSVALENKTDYDLNGQRNIFVTVTSKDLTTSEIVWLTNYTDEDKMVAYTPQLVKISTSQFMVLWEEYNEVTQKIHTRMVLIDENGTVLEDVVRTDVALSDCQPVVSQDGLVKWYVSDGEKVILYMINPNDMQGFTEEEKPTQNPTQDPTQDPAQSIVKGDVDGDSRVTLTDAQIVLKAALKIITLTERQQEAAEVDNDNIITLSDAQVILKVALRIKER